MNKKYIVGGYAASPCLADWDPSAEKKFWAALRDMAHIGGLEIPYYEHIHKFDEAFMFENLSSSWSNTVTLIPGTIDRLAKNPQFGLASKDESGRKEAVAYVAAAREAVLRLNKSQGRPAVLAVQVHSAPSGGDQDALAESLAECAAWDWNGAQLLIEHCDSPVSPIPPAKGFLPLADEIGAVFQTVASVTPVGLLINWGRSAIEGRNPDLPLDHIKKVRASSMLKGLIFSGAAAQDPYHGEWRDSHAPFARSDAKKFGAEGSLLTKERAGACVEAAMSDNLILGVKMQPLPKETALENRIGMIAEALEILDECACQRH